MPLDEGLPSSRLPPHASADEIARHFPARFGLRVDLADLPTGELLPVAGARLPEPPEAELLDRVLQLVHPTLLSAVARVLVVDSGAVGRLGIYRHGIIRIGTDALRTRMADPEYGGRSSIFATTILHEIGHAVFAERLAPAQRAAAEDLYLKHLIDTRRSADAEPTTEDAEHHFVRLFVAAALGMGYGGLGPAEVREHIRALGVPLR